MTILSGALYNKFGDPHKERNLALWYCPLDLLEANPNLPKRIYLNKDLSSMLTRALYKCRDAGVLHEIKTFDGCFNIRNIRGGGSQSTHSYAYAIDWNAKHNPLGKTRWQCLAAGLVPFTDGFVACWEQTGWEWGGRWSRADGMHFQPAKLP